MKQKQQTIQLKSKPMILNTSCVVGPKEKSGPLKSYFDRTVDDVLFGEKTFEKAESKFSLETLKLLLSKENLGTDDIDYIFGGDLLNQCIGTAYSVRELNIPFFGLYGACSTFVESIMLSSLIIEGNFADKVLATASSHFCSAERQFRLPLEQGTQRTPTGQWTVTGSGAALITPYNTEKCCPIITYITPGKIVDMGIKDVSNMGAAMAPAAFDTITTHLEQTGRDASYYDLILTGDLGYTGGDILMELMQKSKIDISKNYNDCGRLIFNTQEQDTHAGGSGCGCIASVFSSVIYSKLKSKELNKVLLIATGALMSPISLGQGESIPGIAHAIAIENEV